MEDFYNALWWTMIRDSSDSHPGPTVTVTHDCTKEFLNTDALAVRGGGEWGLHPLLNFRNKREK